MGWLKLELKQLTMDLIAEAMIDQIEEKERDSRSNDRMKEHFYWVLIVCFYPLVSNDRRSNWLENQHTSRY